jgi:hypothetical protein
MLCQDAQLLHVKSKCSKAASGAVAHREVAAVARFLARRRCLRRSAGSLMVVRSTSGLRLPMRGSFFADVGDREPVKSLRAVHTDVQ